MTGNPHVLIISASFGAGHDRAADQLAWRLQAAGWPIRQLDLLNLLPAGLGPALRRGYHTKLRLAPASWDWALSVAASPRVGAGVNRLVALATARLQEHVSAGTAAAVSTYPLTSQLLGAMRTNGALPVPAVTYLTDMSVHPLWIAPGIDAHLAIHPIPAEQARTHGARTVHVIDPLVGPTFRPALTAAEKAAARAQFDLPHRGPLALVATGSWGVGQFETTATDIAASGLATPVIACATNHTARRRLTARRIGIPLGLKQARGGVEGLAGAGSGR